MKSTFPSAKIIFIIPLWFFATLWQRLWENLLAELRCGEGTVAAAWAQNEIN